MNTQAFRRLWATMLTVLLLFTNLSFFSIFGEPLSTQEHGLWQISLPVDSGEVTHLFNVGTDAVLITKFNKKSSIYTFNGLSWNTIATDLPEIDVAYESHGQFIILGNKEGKVFRTYTKSEDSWNFSSITNPALFKSEKAGALYANGLQLIVSIDKVGIFRSNDAGQNWTTITGNMTSINSKLEDVLPRAITVYQNNVIVGSKKFGILVSQNTGDGAGTIWTSHSDGLSGNALEIFEFAHEENVLSVATKGGIYTTNLDQQQMPTTFTADALTNGQDFRIIRNLNGQLFSSDRTLVYLLLNDLFIPYSDRPSTITYNEVKGLASSGNDLLVAYKQGVIITPIHRDVNSNPGSDSGSDSGQQTPPTLWRSIGPNQNQTTQLLNLGEDILLIQKNNKRSFIFEMNDQEKFNPIASDLPEIDVVYVEGDNLYVLGNKEGKIFRRYYKDNSNWAYQDLNRPAEFGSERAVTLFVDGDNMLVTIEKVGLFKSVNSSANWTLINSNMSAIHSKLEDILPRALIVHEDTVFAASKKFGLLYSTNAFDSEHTPTWIQFTQGLNTANSMELFDILKHGTDLIIATKAGAYRVLLDEDGIPSDQFHEMEGLELSEVRSLNSLEGKLVAGTKNMVFYLNGTQFEPYKDKPADLIIDEARSLSSSQGVLYIGHKLGVIATSLTVTPDTVETIASKIKHINAPLANATKLQLPTVPNGFSINVYSSSNFDTINLDGTITPPSTDEIVTLVLKIEDTQSHAAFTSPIAILVPKAVTAGDYDGTYTATVNAYGGPLTLSVTVLQNKIVAVTILSHRESIERNNVVQSLNTIPQRIVEANSDQVDTISGATVTGYAITTAVRLALRETGVLPKAPEQSHKIIIGDGQESVSIIKTTEGYVLVQKIKDQKRSLITRMTSTYEVLENFETSTEVDFGFYHQTTQTIYLLGAKEGPILLTSLDQGATFTQSIPTGLGKEKIEWLMAHGNDLIAVVGKFGIYRSSDKGLTWYLDNGNLPVSPEKASEYDARRIYAIKDIYFMATKKQGLLRSTDLKNWQPVTTSGLSSDGRDVWELSQSPSGNLLFITGKAGIWSLPLEDALAENPSGSWQREAHTAARKEGRALMTIDSALFALTKDLTLLHYNEKSTPPGFEPFFERPSGFSGEDSKSQVFNPMSSELLLAHKSGLVTYPIDLFTATGNGTFEGMGMGHEGPIRVKVTLKNHTITQISILSHNETTSMSEVRRALDKTPKDIVTQQKIDVDSVSGATYTSKGISQAVKRALIKTSFVSDPYSADMNWNGPRATVEPPSAPTLPSLLIPKGSLTRDHQNRMRLELPTAALKDALMKSNYSNTLEVEIDQADDKSPLAIALTSEIGKILVDANKPLIIKTGAVYYHIEPKLIQQLQRHPVYGLLKEVTLIIEDIPVEDLDISESVTYKAPAIFFNLEVSYENGMTHHKHFDRIWSERLIKLSKDVDPSHDILTGVVLINGQWEPVLTKFILIDHEWYASILRNGNSTYTVISHDSSFDDIANHWAYHSINTLGQQKIVKGYKGDFLPDRTVTRAEYATMLIRALGLTSAQSSTDSNQSLSLHYSDLEQHNWFYNALSTAVAYDLLTGYGNGLLAPNATITREEMAAMTLRAYDLITKARASSIQTARPSIELVDGIYRASASGYSSNIVIDTHVINGKIENLTLISHAETPGFVDIAMEEMRRRILFEQKPDVDSVSGATITSRGISNAVQGALSQASQGELPKRLPANERDYEDFIDIAPWARETVLRALELGLMVGSEGLFRPKEYTSRAEAATLLARLIENLKSDAWQ
jgi:uncharacterized protein with FMN-binding domain